MLFRIDMSGMNLTKIRLLRWGRWARGGIIGFPMMAAFMRVRSERVQPGEVDPELLRTDLVVSRAERDQRLVLIRHYCTDGTGKEKAQKLGIPKSTYFDYLGAAQHFVHMEYDRVICDESVAKFRKTCYEIGHSRLAVSGPR